MGILSGPSSRRRPDWGGTNPLSAVSVRPTAVCSDLSEVLHESGDHIRRNGILLGQTVDTNAAHIARSLAGWGGSPYTEKRLSAIIGRGSPLWFAKRLSGLMW